MAGKKFDLSEFAKTLPDRADLPDSGMTREIPVDDILDNPRNFYPRPDNQALGALMESIQVNGLLEPPTVVPAEDGKYRLISGHSRMAAVRLLATNKDETVSKQFAAVLCRVLPAMTPAQEECAVIEANRQRVKSNALLAQEAEKLKENYIRRKKAGEEFPVGLRDWIAKEMQINATKVGNLQVIKKGLKVPGIIARWESGELPEAAALEIARMDDETQYRLLDWVLDHYRTWSINNVREFRTCWTCCKHKCPDTGGFCPNAAKMYADRYRNGEWRCAGCCRECLCTETCSAACRFVVGERFAGGIAAPPQKTPTNPAVSDPRLKNMTPKFCERVKALREATGLTRKEFAESIGEYPGTYSAWENNSLAGAGSLPKLALTLGTTMDYLCGLTDDPAPKPPALFSVDLCAPEWLPLDAQHWPTEGALVVLSYETGLGGSSYLVARCAGGADDEYPFIVTSDVDTNGGTWSTQPSNGGAGGEGGLGGEGGRILSADLDVTPGTGFAYSVAEEATFGGLSSANGSRSDAGFTDPITGDVYGKKGDDGLAGGDGGDGGRASGSNFDSGENGEDVGSYTGGEGAVGDFVRISDSNSSYNNGELTVIGGPGGGGAAYGKNGANASKAFAPTFSVGNGADASAPSEAPSYGCGGNGGHGGGGAGGAPGMYETHGSYKHSGTSSGKWLVAPGGTGGTGSKGSSGKPGCIILYYRRPKLVQSGWLKDKNGKLVLDRLGRRIIK